MGAGGFFGLGAAEARESLAQIDQGEKRIEDAGTSIVVEPGPAGSQLRQHLRLGEKEIVDFGFAPAVDLAGHGFAADMHTFRFNLAEEVESAQILGFEHRGHVAAAQRVLASLSHSYLLYTNRISLVHITPTKVPNL